MAKFEIGDAVKTAAAGAPPLTVSALLGACDFPHDCNGMFRAVPVDPSTVSFTVYEGHVDDFERIPTCPDEWQPTHDPGSREGLCWTCTEPHLATGKVTDHA